MADSNKVRLVRCPKCENLLSEPEDSPFYQCGGCGTVLRAKIREREADSVSDKSEEDKSKEILLKTIVMDSSESSSSSSDSAQADVNIKSKSIDFDSSNCSKIEDKDDPKSKSGRQELGSDQFTKRAIKRYDSEEHKDAAINQDRAGLLRKLDKLKEQLTQSCNVIENPKEQPPNSSSSSLNKPPLRFFTSDQHIGGPSYHPEESPFPYNGVPHNYQMHRRVQQPYFSGHYIGNNSHDLFETYPKNRHFHQQSCSCYNCWRISIPPDHQPYNAGLYPHDLGPVRNPRGYVSSLVDSRGLPVHRRWSSNFNDAEIDSYSRIRPRGLRQLRPLAGGAPFITCQNCFELLQLPKSSEVVSKLRCGSCSCLIDLSIVDKKKFVLSTNQDRNRQVRSTADYTSDDYDLLGYVYHSIDDDQEPIDITAGPRAFSGSESEDDESLESLTAKPVDKFEFSTMTNDRSGVGSISSRSEQEKVSLSKSLMRQNSLKEASLATEMEIYSQSKDLRSKKEGFASIVKRSLKDLTKSIQNKDNEGSRRNVSVNGYVLTERLIRKAEKQAGNIQPGNYWYDYRAGFWGVMGGPCLGILPPLIEELNYPMPEKCAGGTTGVFVNGRELHSKDLNLLAGRGLPVERNRSYILDITGRVVDEDTGQELDCLGKLAPTIEKLKKGFGMRLPRRAV